MPDRKCTDRGRSTMRVKTLLRKKVMGFMHDKAMQKDTDRMCD